MIKYLKKGDKLHKEAIKRGFIPNNKITALRPTIAREIESCSAYDIHGYCGNVMKYDTDTDTLYISGQGLYVIMEKGIWAEIGHITKPKNIEPQYEIY